MSEETIYFMLHKIFEFEKFEGRIFDLENKNVELEANWRIVKDQLDKLTQNGKLSEGADSGIQTRTTITDTESGSNFVENHLENDKISTNQDEPSEAADSEVQTQDQCSIADTDTDSGSNFVENHLENDKIFTNQDQEMNFDQSSEISIEMNDSINGSQDGNNENCDSDLLLKLENNKSEASTTITSPQIISISSEMKPNWNLLAKNPKEPKILQNLVIPLKRVDLDPNFISKCMVSQNGSKNVSKLEQSNNKCLNCPFCPREFQEFANFSSHIRTHIRIEEKPHKCPKCSESFAFLDTFIQHCTTIHSKKVIEANLTKSAVSTGKLPTSSCQPGSRNYQCKICPKFFKFQSSFDHHMKLHNKPFKCSTCSMAFISKSALKVHNRVHTGEKPYSCSVCEKKFTQKQHLIAHTRTHTGEKPLNCPFCERKFSDPSSRSKHVNAHTK